MNIWERWHFRAGKDHQDPKKILKIFQMILARVQKVCLPDSLIMCLYIVNKVVKQDLKMTKIWAKFVQKSLTGPKRWHWLCISNVNQNQKIFKSPWYIKYFIYVCFSLKENLMNQVWNHLENLFFCDERSWYSLGERSLQLALKT